ncbi:cellulase family glycosylhydrolase [Roseateles asaccharophilus]|uniref:Glycoside hydrolase family 5 domain-containing protein n=1 Tax=Roseateles asaccharophilus TaxID=582607 RepID=A0ABU2A9I8_9BURK|nr:cellulase family glycosylhydrolase [Roseateles asaccharophilus]MDR7333790.1 hypothetical protein [Roseateles asaccharophilus]
MKRREILAALVPLSACGGGGGSSPAAPPPPVAATSAPAPAPTPGRAGTMHDITSLQLSKQMGAVKAAGFKTARIPCAWKQYADAGDNISAAWPTRVAEVVGFAQKAGLVVMLNIHWDGGWDAGAPTENHSSGLFNRATGAQVYPDIIKALVEAAQ